MSDVSKQIDVLFSRQTGARTDVIALDPELSSQPFFGEGSEQSNLSASPNTHLDKENNLWQSQIQILNVWRTAS